MERHWLSTKAEGAIRYLMVSGLSGLLPLYIVTEYPKSGGSWVAQMLSDYLNLPFPRNRFPKLQSSVIHGHYLYSPTIKNAVVVFRDGRDVMVSFYYHSLFKNERFNARLVEITRRDLQFDDYEDIKSNLPKFIEYKFTRKKAPRFTWSEFVNSWLDRDVPTVKYEDLLRNPVKEMSNVIGKLCKSRPDERRLGQIAEKYSFKNLAKRNPGEENKRSFLRKGIAGDWRNHFTSESRRIFNEFAGKELVKLGYEVDDGWV